MAMFVHLASEANISRIRRVGINRSQRRRGNSPRGVYAVPVTPNFFLSHQWLRELKRASGRMLTGIYFRIPDNEDVFVGRFNEDHRWLSAAQAVAAFMSVENREGWEVIIPRRITPREIQRIKVLPQTVGWKYYPASNGRQPFCRCEYCTRGEYGSRRLRAKAQQ